MKYRYTARDDKLRSQKGTVDAANTKAAAAILKERKLIPVSITPIQPWMDLGRILARFSKISSLEVTNFTRQLSTMITAGLPITDGLNLLKLQASGNFSQVVESILEDVRGGVSLSNALA